MRFMPHTPFADGRIFFSLPCPTNFQQPERVARIRGDKQFITDCKTLFERWAIMAGIVTFRNLVDAIRAGYTVYDKTGTDYLVRMKTARGWALAVVKCEANARKSDSSVAC
jgi:hypothetical protein